MEMDPYQWRLKTLGDKEVTIDRRGTSQVKGKVTSLNTSGCVISAKHPIDPEALLETFIAFRDICGVGTVEWDHDLFDH